MSVSAKEISALGQLGNEGIWELGGRELKVTNLDKVLFAGRGDDPEPVTKRDLIRYFALIAPVMLPASRGAPAQPPPLSERRRSARVLAEEHPEGAGAAVAADLAGNRRR